MSTLGFLSRTMASINSWVINVWEPSWPLLCRRGLGSMSVSHHIGCSYCSRDACLNKNPPSSLPSSSEAFTLISSSPLGSLAYILILGPCRSPLSVPIDAPFQQTEILLAFPRSVLIRAVSFQKGLL